MPPKSLLDEARAVPKRTGGLQACSLAALLDGPRGPEVGELVADHTIQHSVTAEIICRALEVEVSADIIGRHRRGTCRVCRKAGIVW